MRCRLRTNRYSVELHALPGPQTKAGPGSILATDTECAVEYLQPQAPQTSTPCEPSCVRTETVRKFFVRNMAPLGHCTGW